MSESKGFNHRAIASAVLAKMAPTIANSIYSYATRSAQGKKSGGSGRLTKSTIMRSGLGAPTSGGSSTSSRRRRRRKSQGGSQPRQSGGGDAPVNFSNTMCMTDSMFKTRPIRSGTHGPGINCAFSCALTNVGSNGVESKLDYQNALGTYVSGNSLGTPLLESGFITDDNSWSSGILVHPGLLSSRLIRESENWTEFRPRRLTFSFANQVPTSASGSLTMAFTRDPDSFIEAGGTQAGPTHSYTTLTQNIPNCTGNVYKDMSMTVGNFDQSKYYPCEVAASAPYTVGNNVATLAYNSTHYPGRFVCMYTGPPQQKNFGILWVSGSFDFFGPTSSFISIGYTVTSLLSAEKPICFWRNKWITHRQLFQLVTAERKLHVLELEIKKKTDEEKSEQVFPDEPVASRTSVRFASDSPDDWEKDVDSLGVQNLTDNQVSTKS